QPGIKTNMEGSLLSNIPTEGDINKRQTEDNQETREGRKEYDQLLRHLDAQFEKLREEIQANTMDIKKEWLTLNVGIHEQKKY
ncbi:Hypothetical predicted protein, partial [Pelobates cultripes]